MERIQVEHQFRVIYASLIANGTPPNEAAAQALAQAMQQQQQPQHQQGGNGGSTTSATTSGSTSSESSSSLNSDAGGEGNKGTVSFKQGGGGGGGEVTAMETDDEGQGCESSTTTTIKQSTAPLTPTDTTSSPSNGSNGGGGGVEEKKENDASTKEGGGGGGASTEAAAASSSSTNADAATKGIEPEDVAMDVVEVDGISLDLLKEMLNKAATSGHYKEALVYLEESFKQSAVLNQSFVPPPTSSSSATTATAMEEGGEKEKKEEEEGLRLNIDAVGELYGLLREADDVYKAATGDEEGGPVTTVRQAQELLAGQLATENARLANSSTTPATANRPNSLRQYLILLDNPELMDPSFHGMASPLFNAIVKLNEKAKDALMDWIASEVDPERFGRWLGAIQQYVSIRLYEQSYRDVRTGVRVMAILYKANQKTRRAAITDFYNEAINQELENEDEDSSLQNFSLVEEYDKWRRDRHIRQRRRGGGGGGRFEPSTIFFYPYVLDPSIKAKILNMDAVDQMRAEIEDEMHHAMAGGLSTIRPYLVLRVERDNIVASSLASLALYETYDWKKKLKVQFVGEEGVDEGGVQKEYFQVLFRQMFDPAYGMFKPVDELPSVLWFNPDSFNEPQEFELIGILLGIAVYNSIILDLKFPMIVYNKMMKAKTTLEDLKLLQPAVAKSMENMLRFKPSDFDDLGVTFQLSYEVYGDLKTVELKPGEVDIPVTAENVKEYVDLYVDWVLNKSIQQHFNAFRLGFLKVCGGDALNLFQPEELELLICGNPVLDFEALEKVTQYEDGLETNTPLIRHFWAVLHEFTEDEKKLFLKFLSGSDRAPINGLASMTFIISKNGDDSDRLPTAHTCFNHLLLPAYGSKEKLRERLRLAITQSEGFGLR